jgi:type VII secretion protein EccB
LGLATRTQVSGHWFLRRRLGFAFLRRSVKMEVDQTRLQRVLLMLSAIIGAVLVIGGLVVGWFRPAGVVDDSTKIVADRKSSALYVFVDGRLHPALNLVSAQLVAGEPVQPKYVNPSELAKWPKGPTVGIVGAPVDPPRIASPEVSRWAVCDTASTTMAGAPLVTGINGKLALGEGADLLAGDEGLLLSFDGVTYLVHNGMRMPIDLGDRAVTSALGVDSGAPVQVMSRALFDALPAGGPLVVPPVPDAGAPSRFGWAPGLVVGSVVSSQDVTGGEDRFFVVLEDGVQQVSPVVAAMLREKESFGAATPPKVSPDQLGEAPVRQVLDVDFYPSQPVRVVDGAAKPVACVAWEFKVGDRQAQLHVLSGRGLPIRSEQQGQLVPLVGGGSDGVQANQVLLSDDPATFVTATGSALDSPRRQTIWLITDSGTRFGVPFDVDTLRALGLARGAPGGGPELLGVRSAPWVMLQVWPSGPELSQSAARTVHDSLDGAMAPLKAPAAQQNQGG